jgi:hypothetical protein
MPAHSFSFFDPATAKLPDGAQQADRASFVTRGRRRAGRRARAPEPSPPRTSRARRERRRRWPARAAHDPGHPAARRRNDELVAHARDASPPAWSSRPPCSPPPPAGRALWRRFGPDEASQGQRHPGRPPARARRPGRARRGHRRGLLSGARAAPAQRSRSSAPAPEGQGLPRRALLDLLARRAAWSRPRTSSASDALLDRCDAARFGAASEGRAASARRPSTTRSRCCAGRRSARRRRYDAGVITVSAGPGAAMMRGRDRVRARGHRGWTVFSRTIASATRMRASGRRRVGVPRRSAAARAGQCDGRCHGQCAGRPAPARADVVDEAFVRGNQCGPGRAT